MTTTTTTTTTSAASAASATSAFYTRLHKAGRPLPRFPLDASVESLLSTVPSGREAKGDEVDAIVHFVGNYRVGEPHGTQLDLARHMARKLRDPHFAEVEVRTGQILHDLSAAEREVIRRWRNYERRARIAKDKLSKIDASILESLENGESPKDETLAERNALREEVKHWRHRAASQKEGEGAFPLEVDQYEEAPSEGASLEELVTAQRADMREWARRTGGVAPRLPDYDPEDPLSSGFQVAEESE